MYMKGLNWDIRIDNGESFIVIEDKVILLLFNHFIVLMYTQSGIADLKEVGTKDRSQ